MLKCVKVAIACNGFLTTHTFADISEVRSRLYPYGPSANDTQATFDDYDDGNTLPIWLANGFQLGCKTYYKFHVSSLL